ncbi:MAG: glycosyltransferase family 4 protein [Gemmatimonadaceae bacterium]
MTATNSAPPKVIVVTPWYGGSEGGVAVVTESLVQSLMSARIPCCVIELLADAKFPRMRQGAYGETVVGLCVRDPAAVSGSLSKVGAVARDILAKRAFKSLLPTDGRKCVVHFHYSAAEYELFVNLCARYNLPAVSTFHGGDLVVNLRDARTYDVAKLQVQRSGAVTAVSESLRETTLHFFPDIGSRLSVIYNAVPPDFSASIQQTAATGVRDIDVLYVGNLIERKGVDVLLRAWAAVQRDRPSGRLAVAGAGEQLSRLQSLANELGVAKSVDFLGRKSRSELPSLYQRAKVLAVPSRSEPLGVVVLEGALSGAAVVASNTGGIPEMITNEKTGLLVTVDSPEHLAAALLRLLNNDQERRMFAERARLHVAERFGAAHIIEQYQDIYTRLTA